MRRGMTLCGLMVALVPLALLCGGRAVAGIMPDSVANLVSWHKADAGVSADGSGFVTEWADSSANTYDAAQANANKRPVRVPGASPNGLVPLIRFTDAATDALDDVLKIDNNPLHGKSDFTIFAVALNAADNTGGALSGPIIDNRHGTLATGVHGISMYLKTSEAIHGINEDSFVCWNGPGYGWFNSVRSTPANSIEHARLYQVTTKWHTGGGAAPLSVWIDGAPQALSNWTANAVSDTQAWQTPDPGLGIGGSVTPYTQNHALTGDIGELIIYDRLLTDPEREGIEAYLHRKWYYQPPDLAGVTSGELLSWHRADAGVSTDGSGAVTEWADGSGHGHHAAQTDPNKRPVLVPNASPNGRHPVIRFSDDATNPALDDVLKIATNPLHGEQQFTIFAVALNAADNTGGALSGPIIDNRSEKAPHIAVHGISMHLKTSVPKWGINEDSFVYWNGTGIWQNSARSTPTNSIEHDEFYLITTTWESGATDPLAAWIDGVSQQPLTDWVGGVANTHEWGGADPGLGIGGSITGYTAGSALTGDIAELIIYRGVLSDADRQAVESYLYYKWIVPEPSTMLLLVLGGCGLLRRRRS